MERTKPREKYPKGQQVQINVGSLIAPEWVEAVVTETITEDKSLSLRVMEKLLGLKPVTVQVDENDRVFGGNHFTLYDSGSKIRTISNPRKKS